ncbi:J domain-containing protein [Pseudoalteromonas sp. Of7M-16]|uniref:J domain-containing protein n=1 Tax=Pseudoalteromonas sp. Of7M-16 TaxID=2917756 RepID=UPI001EF58B50|nr:J domain-containing protein [Pseudoalteromonas sp. Of7M-16]MCG7549040.1 hypothetical protein [Pseudoalteromonas sp. Of7M-16]
MTSLLFAAAGFILMGYLIGKLFVRFNPALILIGLFPLFGVWVTISGLENKTFASIFFIIGMVLNFNRPLSYVRTRISDVAGTIRLRKLSNDYASNIEAQKQQAERELYEQKRKIEEEIKRQKKEAEQELQRQRQEAEESIKREAENLRKERERYERKQSNNQNQANSEQSSSSQSNKQHLNPLVFADACEILGLGQGKTLKEYKAAYLKLMKLYHSDKLAGLSDELRKQEEEKAKALNVAWATVKKKLK